jgi:hypothetical protein
MAMEMAVRSMETAEMAMETDGDGPEICRWRRRSCKTSSRKTPTDLGFGLREALNRRRCVIKSGPGPPHHMAVQARGGAPPYGEPAL